jgi:hypothetical protein
MKKNTFILLISCFLYYNLSAQDWHVVKQHDVNYYYIFSEKNAPDYYLKRLLFIGVESSNVLNNDSVYNYYHTTSLIPVQSNVTNQKLYCVDTLTPSWLGQYSIRKSNGDEFFIVNYLDSLLIKTNAGINDSWNFYHRRIDSVDFVATVSNIDILTIDNSIDSVKTIRLSTYKNGLIIPNNLNDSLIILSKNNGVLKMYEYYFLNYTSNTVFPATRIDKTKYIKTQSQVIESINQLYTAGNSWAFVEYSGYNAYPGVDNLYVYDSIISTQVLNTTQKKANIIRQKKYRNEFGEIKYSTLIFDSILDFSIVQSRNLFEGIYPFKNQFSFVNNGIINNNVKSYYILNEQTDLKLYCTYDYHDVIYYPNFLGVENYSNFYSIDSCIKYSYYVGLGSTSGSVYLQYDNQFSLFSKNVNEQTSSLLEPYIYNYSLGYLKLGNVITGNYPLPISKIVIQAIAKKNDINQITWQTFEELNVDHFDIERNTNQLDFVKVGNVNSLGNSTNNQQYLFEDDVKYISNSTFLYRIKSVDIDGKYQYSNIVSLQKIKVESFSIYPNPFKDNIIIEINLNSVSNYSIQISNAIGIVVKKSKGNLNFGNNIIQLSNLESLPKGIYFLQFSSDDKETKTFKLIKQ